MLVAYNFHFDCTIHKIQGMTLQRAVVSFQGRFFNGQCYVALSRVSSLYWLFFTDYAENKITASSATTRAMKEMTTNCLSIVLNPIT
jgi:ATP-dependent exoDNAse (exonuclease V) alpha subunit